jgi:tetratricopeptide (TPR) repeat protein
MIPERWDEIQSLFGEVVDLEPGERVERLAVISETDPELYSEVQSLLAAHAQVDDRLGLLEDLASPIGGADVEAVARKQASDPYGLLDRTVSHYRILEALGGGGMGILYKAMDARLDRIVALKFLPPQWSLDAAFKERFEHEARAAAALDHNHVCNIYEIGETREGQLFIAMAYYEGKTVKEELTEGPMEIDEALGLAAQAASGLAAAHARGIVHRDIKPANLMITGDGVLKILDFGLAKTAETVLTDTGMRLGTPAYMSPEQTRGEEITASTDLWSLGVVLYEMLTGRQPFRGDRQGAVIHAIRHDVPEPPRELRADLPQELDQIVSKLLEKDRDKRYQSAETLLTDLLPLAPEGLRVERPIPVRTPWAAAGPFFWSQLKQRKVARGVAGALAVAAIVGGAVVGVLAIFPGLPGGHEASLDPNLVAVAVLENQTGQADLGPLGRQAAARIALGVHQQGVAVVPTEAALAAAEEGEGLAGPEGIAAFARASGAGVVIHGDYYLVGHSLHFQLQITDVAKGEIMSAVKPVMASRERPDDALRLVQDRTLGTLAAALDFRDGDLIFPTQPPSVEAYRLFWQGQDARLRDEIEEALGHFDQARAMDSTWISPLLYTALTLRNLNRRAEGDSLLQIAAGRRQHMTEPEHLTHQILQASTDLDPVVKLRSVRRLATLAPGVGLRWGYHVAMQAYRPREALEFLARIDTASPGFERFEAEYWRYTARMHHPLEQFEEQLEAAREGRRRFPNHMHLLNHQLAALAALGRTAEIETLLDTVFALPATEHGSSLVVPHLRAMTAGRELRVHGYPDAAGRILQRGLDWVEARPPEWMRQHPNWYWSSKAMFLYELGRWEEARDLYERLAEEPDNWDPPLIEEADILAALAGAAARLGDTERARAMSARFTEGFEGSLSAAKVLRTRARIAAVLGKRDEAMQLLRDGFRASSYGGGYVGIAHLERDFESLHDYLPYQQFLKPRS